MAESKNNSRTNLRRFTFKAIKATIKGVLFYVLYLVLWIMFLAPVAEMVPGLQQMIETFVIVYIVLIVVGELTSGTIFQYFFDAARAVFMIGFLLLSLGGGMFGISVQNVDLIVDFRLLLAIATLLSLLGLAKSILQAINHLNEKAEYAYI